MPLHNITAIVRNLLKERIPISDMRRILEVLSEMAGRNLGVPELSEALRPYLVELLIQQSVPLSQPIPVITIDSDFEHLLINTARQSDSEQIDVGWSTCPATCQKLDHHERRANRKRTETTSCRCTCDPSQAFNVLATVFARACRLVFCRVT